MVDISRRALLGSGITGAALSAMPPSIARAATIAPDIRSGTIADIDHIVILMQENRGFDHYFGSMRGVRGFGDRFPIPLAPERRDSQPRPVWQQSDRNAPSGPRVVTPFHLAVRRNFDLMRMRGTPHNWPDAQRAWDEGRMAHWPEVKEQRAMGYYRRNDIPFQFALADAFTICDAYHCSIQTGTNSNRLFLWSGTNDPGGTMGGPAISNSHDQFADKGGFPEPYRWTTTVERLQEAGIDWRIYQDMADNFTDNPLVGFAAFRDAYRGEGNPELKDRALKTQALDVLKADVLAGRLPQVSYIIATATGSEHPGPSSPAQGAEYTAAVLDALTADPKLWARTALFIMFDENDGFFDHMPPPAPPSRSTDGTLHGGSSIDLTGEYHLMPSAGDADADLPELRGRPYGLGPRVPMYVVSPWSRGGWVNSQIFDHTSVIRFLEARFGIRETNISPWRRAICGDLTSAFDFGGSDTSWPSLPDPAMDAHRAAALTTQISPSAPEGLLTPWQEPGIRRARPLPYRLEVTDAAEGDAIALTFSAEGAAAVFHVYDRLALDQAPQRYSVGAGDRLKGRWPVDRDHGYDLWIIGPNGFHRHFAGGRESLLLIAGLSWSIDAETLAIDLPESAHALKLTLSSAVTGGTMSEPRVLAVGKTRLPLREQLGWYDVTLRSEVDPGLLRRFAGRNDGAGRATCSDPFGAAERV
ncbi:phosphocholine-specific phospholipase C [Stakelama pacifica]|uniref:phospholipase C n=1 Tax=Stakelama pacifica TaxID=517720 RepID=A0A4R6FYI3_9SPHN|nr:phospholipase C, phosphocholine-specific [Stakelama pacifica]MAX01287.1 phospholipase C, phosphocholine-specific [Sphingomonas sp.]TDN86897.1 phospholipase C [Stakelama pacifica]GGO91007.1 phospholipase C [Stakelama pacifica]